MTEEFSFPMMIETFSLTIVASTDDSPIRIAAAIASFYRCAATGHARRTALAECRIAAFSLNAFRKINVIFNFSSTSVANCVRVDEVVIKFSQEDELAAPI